MKQSHFAHFFIILLLPFLSLNAPIQNSAFAFEWHEGHFSRNCQSNIHIPIKVSSYVSVIINNLVQEGTFPDFSYS